MTVSSHKDHLLINRKQSLQHILFSILLLICKFIKYLRKYLWQHRYGKILKPESNTLGVQDFMLATWNNALFTFENLEKDMEKLKKQ